MQAKISHFRRGKRTQSDNQMVVHVTGVSSRDDAQKLVGKEVTFKTTSGKEIKGVVSSAHGNSGKVRARFEKGMPGQSIAQPVHFK